MNKLICYILLFSLIAILVSAGGFLIFGIGYLFSIGQVGLGVVYSFLSAGVAITILCCILTE